MIDASELAALGASALAGAARIPVVSNAAARTAAEATARTMRANAAVLTGEMRDSVSITPAGLAAYEIGPTSPHSRFVEYGTSVMPPQPFVAPALEANIGGLISAVGDVAGEIL